MPSNITLTENEDGSFDASYPVNCYRFLLEDGSTIDVHAIQDNSSLRETVLAHTKSKKIEGVAYLKPAEEVEEKPAPKKVPAKKVGRARGAA